MLETLNSIDTSLFLAINRAHDPIFDFIMYWASNRLIWIPLYVFLAYLVYRLYGKKSWYLILGAGLVVILTDQTSVHLFKNVFLRLRPCHEPSISGMIHLVNDHCGGQYGFISSHAANSFGIATYLSLLLGKKIRYFAVAMVLWAALLCYSRVYLGVHYPGDVIVGGLWGAAIGASIYLVLQFAKLLDGTRMNADATD